VIPGGCRACHASMSARPRLAPVRGVAASPPASRAESSARLPPAAGARSGRVRPMNGLPRRAVPTGRSGAGCTNGPRPVWMNHTPRDMSCTIVVSRILEQEAEKRPALADPFDTLSARCGSRRWASDLRDTRTRRRQRGLRMTSGRTRADGTRTDGHRGWSTWLTVDSGPPVPQSVPLALTRRVAPAFRGERFDRRAAGYRARRH